MQPEIGLYILDGEGEMHGAVSSNALPLIFLTPMLIVYLDEAKIKKRQARVIEELSSRIEVLERGYADKGR